MWEGIGGEVPVEAPQGLDGYIVDVATSCSLRSIRLWSEQASLLVDVSSKSLQLVCPDAIWPEVAGTAIHAADALVVVSGPGDGLAWELELIRSKPALQAKTLHLSEFAMEEIKGALTTHFSACSAKAVNLHARRHDLWPTPMRRSGAESWRQHRNPFRRRTNPCVPCSAADAIEPFLYLTLAAARFQSYQSERRQTLTEGDHQNRQRFSR